MEPKHLTEDSEPETRRTPLKELPKTGEGIFEDAESSTVQIVPLVHGQQQHQWVQRGPYKVCVSCPYEHTLSAVSL
jgi:hypothetical protein